MTRPRIVIAPATVFPAAIWKLIATLSSAAVPPFRAASGVARFKVPVASPTAMAS